MLCLHGIRSYSAERSQLLASPIRPQDNKMWDDLATEHLMSHACFYVSVILGGFARHGTGGSALG